MSQYFEAASRAQRAHVVFERLECEDESPDLSYLETTADNYDGHCSRADARKYAAQDAARLDAYRDGDWHMIGIAARAHITLPVGSGSFVALTLDSPGVYGIESDSDAAHIAETFENECGQLRTMMQELGNAAIADAAIREICK